MSTEETVVTSRDGRVGRILLNRPRALNALDLQMIRACAAVLGGWFLVEAHRLHGAARKGVEGVALKPMRMFHFSNTYLALLFVCAAIAPLLR